MSKKQKKLKLNLGCEDKIKKGFINIDINSREGVKTYNLNKLPLPFKNNSVRYILASHVIEHLDNPVDVMLELYRICEDDARIDIYVPHFSIFAAHADLTHKKTGYSYFTFGEDWTNKMFQGKFKVLNKKINFTRINYKWLNKVFNPLINFSPTIYERFFCYILPASEVKFRLKVLKK